MAEQQEKKQKNQSTGYFLIILGILGIAAILIGGADWTTITIIKLGVAIIVITYGLWSVLKKKTK